MTDDPTRRAFLAAIGGTTAAAAGLGTATAQTDASDWPMAGFDPANTGYNAAVSAPESAPGVSWQFETGEFVNTSPAVVDGTVYAGSLDGYVYALDAESGDEIWRFETGGNVDSSPTVVDGTVFVGSNDGNLYAIDADGSSSDGAGSEEWRFETGGAVRSAPAVRRPDESGGTDDPPSMVYVGSGDGRVYGIDRADGTERWQFQTSNVVSGSPAYASASQLGATASTGMVFIGNDDGAVYAFEADGTQRWVVETGGRIGGAPAVRDGTVYIGSFDGRLYALEAIAENVRWTFDTGGQITAAPSITSERVYVGSRSGFVFGLDPDSGEEAWNYNTESTISNQPAVLDNGLVVSAVGELLGLSHDGEKRWGAEANELSAAAVTDGSVFVGGGQSLLALSPGADGSIVDDVTLPDAEPEDDPLEAVRFLFLPALAVGVAGSFAGLIYIAKRTGFLDWVERRADAVESPLPEPEDDEGGDGATAANDPTAVWELVQADVINRADETVTAATENLVVTKYVDPDTLDSPVVAYEIESYRDEPVTVRLTEQLAVDDPAPESQPKGDNWQIVDDEIQFEGVVEPDDAIRTIVGRPDVAADDVDDLLDSPAVTIVDE